MAEGFIFNHNRCVACGACRAACILENKWPVSPRTIFTYNKPGLPSLPVINLSLACNHCKTAVCMDGCPASAFNRDEATGAIVIDDSKCIGCRYCQWNCPYDAPKFHTPDRIIIKCNLCYQRLKDGLMPACTTACPTGALESGETADQDASGRVTWFPEKNLRPSVELHGGTYPPLRVFPENRFDTDPELIKENKPLKNGEWSLVAFSFLMTFSVAKLISALVDGIFPKTPGFFSVIIIAGLLSLLHLGKKKRAWKAVLNIRKSPLSREIVLFILYSLLSGATMLYQMPLLLIASSVTGLILLLSIDAVYLFADKRKTVFLHSGQTFITALLMVSFLTGKILPFIFVAAIKLVTILWHMITNRDDNLNFVMRFVRTSMLIITCISLISGISYPENAVIILFLTGELLDRIMFYIDFKPLGINRLIYSHLKEAEK